MERALDDAVAEFTALLLVAAVALIGASLLGLGGSLPLAGVLAVASVGLFLARHALADLAADYYLLVRVLEDCWIGTTAATLTVVVSLGTTPGELQTLGGLIGLVGMLNYFLRPLYRLTYRLGRRLTDGANP